MVPFSATCPCIAKCKSDGSMDLSRSASCEMKRPSVASLPFQNGVGVDGENGSGCEIWEAGRVAFVASEERGELSLAFSFSVDPGAAI